MPYEIITTTPTAADISRNVHDPARGGKSATRTPADTLDEARLVAGGIWQKHLGYRKYGYTDDDLKRYGDWAVPESGGTVGPLPDGTVIEVRPS